MSHKAIFDTCFLTYFSDPQALFDFTPEDEFDSINSRFDFLLEELTNSHSEIIIPSPVLAEVLAASHSNTEKILNIINNSSNMVIMPFDARQSIEFGYLYKNSDRSGENRNAFKFDLLILACARINADSIIYTSDKPLRRKSQELGIKTYSFQELRRPPIGGRTSLATHDLFSGLYS